VMTFLGNMLDPAMSSLLLPNLMWNAYGPFVTDSTDFGKIFYFALPLALLTIRLLNSGTSMLPTLTKGWNR
ncbi:MAG: hypothetical protein ACOYNU_14760, partial [Bacteroidales bacterium]